MQECQSTPSDAFAAVPHPARNGPPIGQGEEESLHDVEDVSRLLLVLEEGLVDDSVVLELGQHQLQSPHKEGTTCVAEVVAGQGRRGRVLADGQEIAK